MNGIEKITQRIQENSEQEAERIRQETQKQVDEISADFAVQAAQAEKEILERGQRQVEERIRQMESSAQMEIRKLQLTAKQQVLDEAFAKALEQLCSLSDQEYIDVVAGLLHKSVSGKDAQVIFSEEDRERIGKKAVAKANKLLDKGKKAALAKETRPVRGGFILADGDVEIDCSFETLVYLQREGLERKVAEILFA